MKEFIEKLKNINCLDDLENLNIGEVIYEVSSRGGYLGFCSIDIEKSTGIQSNKLPYRFGIHCNYLGGGLRGSICISDYNYDISEIESDFLYELGLACKRVYISIEDGFGMNDETYGDDINWDAIGTNCCREDGIISSY
jgi:hypothetical protein